MGSGSGRIYLYLAATLVILTVVGVVFVPRMLDGSGAASYKGLSESGQLVDERPATQKLVSTRFPLRPYRSSASASDSGTGGEAVGTQTQRVAPTGEATPAPAQPVGLPTRSVPGMGESRPRGVDRVTTRAWLTVDSPLHTSPKTTSRRLGTAEKGTQVRWVAESEPGWEELLLSDGRSVYVRSSSLTFTDQGEENTRGSLSGLEVDVGALAPTVESFLAALGSGDLLRGETHLDTGAPELNRDSLSGLLAFTQSPGMARLDRIEPSSDGDPGQRLVVITGRGDPDRAVRTLWRWDPDRGRWLLSRWD